MGCQCWLRDLKKAACLLRENFIISQYKKQMPRRQVVFEYYFYFPIAITIITVGTVIVNYLNCLRNWAEARINCCLCPLAKANGNEFKNYHSNHCRLL